MISNSLDFDIVLRGGVIVDGSGGPGFVGDVGIVGDRIVAVGEHLAPTGRQEFDVSGLVVAPGFIDVHTHDDAALVLRPDMRPKLTQGVTTVIAGNCGICAAPVTDNDSRPDLHRMIFKSDRPVAATLEQYLQKVADASPAVNAAFLTGHATLRMEVMGRDLDRSASPPECREMRRLLCECLDAGSLGLSSGLFYAPARSAPTSELIEIGLPLGDYNGMYVTHLRDEGDAVVESLKEAFVIGRASNARVIISHHKCAGSRNFGRSVQTLALIEETARSQSVALDVYPYTAGSTVLTEELVAQSARTIITWCEPHPELSGLELDQVARGWGCSVEIAVARLKPAGALYFLMDESDVIRIIRYGRAMIGSDGLPEDHHPHPRLWGTFPRILGHYVREASVLSLEEAVYRMTKLAAAQFNLTDRGLISVGHFADVCVFDPRTVKDTATFENPVQAAVGIHHVIVNGRVALQDGTPTGVGAGRVLRRQKTS